MRYVKKTVWILVLALLCSDLARAADPFYTSMLQRGGRDFRLGLHAEAVRKLRIACFGLLDEPELLAQGLIQLGAAQSETGDKKGFLETFDRIVEIEERFGAYSTTEVAADLRRIFEQQALVWVPAAELGRAPTLLSSPPNAIDPKTEDLEDSTEYGDPEALALEELESPDLLLQSAQQALQRKKPRQAKPLVDRLLALEPENQEGLCLLGRIGQRLRLCSDAMTGLPLCPSLGSDLKMASYYLECLVATESWQTARGFEESLDDSMRSKRKIARLASKLPPAADDVGAGPGAPSEEGMASDDADPVVSPTREDSQVVPESPPADPLSTEDRAAMQAIRDLAQAASTLADLEKPLRMASELAEARPQAQEAQFLAAEIAYLGSNWTEAIHYFRRAGLPERSQPLLRFYMAVSLYEAGFLDEAAEILVETLPLLKRTALVESYAVRILPEGD